MKSSIFRRGRSDSVEREPLLPAIPGPSIQYEVHIQCSKITFLVLNTLKILIFILNALLFKC